MEHTINWKKTLFGSIYAIALLFIIGIPLNILSGYLPIVANIVVPTVLLPLLTFLGLKLVIEKWMKIPLKSLRFHPLKVNVTGLIFAILLPILVITCYMFVPGTWVWADEFPVYAIICNILFSGLAVGLTEEMIFRGVVMGLFEKKANLGIGIFVSSILFALAHIITVSLNLVSFIQIVFSITLVGCLLALICYFHNHFWNSALIHVVWNGLLLGFIHIGTEPDPNRAGTYILDNRSPLVTGGEFGFETSAITCAVYFLCIILMIWMMKKRPRVENRYNEHNRRIEEL